MITLPDPRNPIPEQLKSDNWAFHRTARSDDPAYRCQNIGNLIDNLITTVKIAGVDDTEINYLLIIPPRMDDHGKQIPEKRKHFKTLIEYLDYQNLGALESWKLYSTGKTTEGVAMAKAVLGSVLFLVYDQRFTTSKKDSFIGEAMRV